MKLASLSFAFVVLFSSLTSYAQDNSTGTERPAVITAPDAIYLEILGSGLVPTLNYDRMLTNELGFRVGIGYLPLGTVTSPDDPNNPITASITTVPVSLSLFPFGATSSKLEIGVSAFYADLVAKSFSKTAAGSGIGFGGILGYRLEFPNGGFLFRGALTPWDLLNHFQMYGGVSLGWAF